VDLAGPALRALDGLGLSELVTGRAGGFTAADERARIRLLDAWPLVGPLASRMAERAVHTVTAHAERDSFQDAAVLVEVEARAA
jgi:hypothetical protein